MVGSILGHYKLVQKLGEGGMGVVYKAHDTHLNRPVAVKLLRSDKVADQERKARFAQEACAASALNHPNIVVIYDISVARGVDYIAMEFVAGRTLQDLLAVKRLGFRESIDISIQIADALTAAHKAGIIHRD